MGDFRGWGEASGSECMQGEDDTSLSGQQPRGKAHRCQEGALVYVTLGSSSEQMLGPSQAGGADLTHFNG